MNKYLEGRDNLSHLYQQVLGNKDMIPTPQISRFEQEK